MLNSGFTARCTLKCAGRKALPICALAAGKIKQGGKKPAGRTSLSEAKSATIKRQAFLQSGRVSLREPRHRLRHPPRRSWRKKASCALRESFLPEAHFRNTSAVKPGIQLSTSPAGNGGVRKAGFGTSAGTKPTASGITPDQNPSARRRSSASSMRRSPTT